MRRRVLALLLLSSTLAALGPGSAAARSPLWQLLPPDLQATEVGGPVAKEPKFHTGFRLDPAGPYEVSVGTTGDAVVVAVGRAYGQKRAAVTRYLARGVPRPERLQATFGNLGKISMRFRESRHRPWFGKKRRCRGAGRFVVRRGVFVGNFRFRGEDGYLTVRTHRAKGSISRLAAKCQPRDRRRAARAFSLLEDSFSGLLASDRDGVDATEFAALSFQGELAYFAQREENRGSLAILRQAEVVSRGELPLNEEVTAGKFAPGVPFHGTGNYRAAPDGSTSWLGDFSVDFPGARRSVLAGPTYETFLEAGF